MVEPESPLAEESRRRPKRGELVEVAIERLGADGHGIGTVRSHPIAVRTALPGSRVMVEVGRRKGRKNTGRVVEVLEASPRSLPARCDHFGTCGGCAFQTLEYGAQLEQLQRIIRAALEAAGIDGVDVAPVLGMEEPWNYRNKMDFTFGNRRWVESDEPRGVDASFALGLHVPGRFDRILDVASCALHFEGADALLSSARRLARAQDLTPWNPHSHEGLLRHLVLRKGMRTGEVMVDLVTSSDAEEEIERYARALLDAHPEVTTFVLNVNSRPASIAIGESERVLFGSGRITEELAGLRFSISANSFFQTNTLQGERLIEVVREEARLSGGEVVHDLYCGAGTFALALAAGAREVVGLESFPAAVADARANALRNGVTNTRFLEGDVLATLAELGRGPTPDVCVLDPPRAGLHPRVVPALVRLAPRRIVYVSCNIESAARDAAALCVGGYRVERARPIDLFPHTPHVECVLTLELASPPDRRQELG